MGRNLFNLKELSITEIEAILDQATVFLNAKNHKKFAGKIACNLFFEPSTRTQYGFQVAEMNLDIKAIGFNPEASSLKKEESFYDTIKTFDAFGADLLVIRHPSNGYYEQLAGKIETPIINAGDGTGDHPTQSLLDLLTIRQEFGSFNGLSVVMVGDIAHSRVVHTNFEAMKRLGMQVYTSGPEECRQNELNFIPLTQALSRCDVVIMLRIQHERHGKRLCMATDEYNSKYGLNHENVSLMKPNAIIMHPAPINRNVEIIDELVECGRSRIFKQVKNGVFIRMAAVKYALEAD
ncbi:MAG: aspartate carbamoyltransferase catalytic subunit [Oscillospiraceae bacterium]|jgi:aspartate carbamoyltransferase catalytic subunit|nr:aspartate carbamoyltransferase catalytic subunit [Oscillospiraceae bacterium]